MYFFYEKEPVSGMEELSKTLHNIFKRHYRGVFAYVLIFAAIFYSTKIDRTLLILWGIIFWYFLTLPVNIPVTALMPIFLFPLTGVLSSPEITTCYFNVNIGMFVLSGMLFLSINNSGADRSISLRFLSYGNSCHFTTHWMIWKSCMAAYFLSFFSNRLIVTSTITQYMTTILEELQAESLKTDPDFQELRYIINNGIQTSATIGSLTFVTAAYTTMIMRAIFDERIGGSYEADNYNFLQYTFFAFPTTMAMVLLNIVYHLLIVHWFMKPLSIQNILRMKSFFDYQRNIRSKGPFCHEAASIVFIILALLILFLQTYPWHDEWTTKSENVFVHDKIIKDVTVVALFVILLHAVPKSFRFMKCCLTDDISDLPSLKPESAILWWRFVDQNINYAYMFVFGCGIALLKASERTRAGALIGDAMDGLTTTFNLSTMILIFILIGAIMCNIMNGAAACAVILPFFLQMAKYSSNTEWNTGMHRVALAIGLSTSFGFMVPFVYTPAYFCHYAGKVPRLTMAKYASISIFICSIVTWFMLVCWAPAVWEKGEILHKNPMLEKITPPMLPFQYIYMPDGQARFRVQARTYACVALTDLPESRLMVQVIIGGWNNTLSAIRKYMIGNIDQLTSTPGILHENEFRSFWIKWDDTSVMVGRGINPDPFITWIDTTLFPNISYIGVMTGKGKPGLWKIIVPGHIPGQ